jgi:hypothetical protein
MNRDELNSLSARVTDDFMNLYVDRMAEYSDISEDWIPMLLTRFARHYSETVTQGKPSIETFLHTEREAVQMLVSLRDCVPELLAEPTDGG